MQPGFLYGAVADKKITYKVSFKPFRVKFTDRPGVYKIQECWNNKPSTLNKFNTNNPIIYVALHALALRGHLQMLKSPTYILTLHVSNRTSRDLMNRSRNPY
jgi:hypothetical protein